MACLYVYSRITCWIWIQWQCQKARPAPPDHETFPCGIWFCEDIYRFGKNEKKPTLTRKRFRFLVTCEYKATMQRWSWTRWLLRKRSLSTENAVLTVPCYSRSTKLSMNRIIPMNSTKTHFQHLTTTNGDGKWHSAFESKRVILVLCSHIYVVLGWTFFVQ